MQAMASCGEIATSCLVRKMARGAPGARGVSAAPPVDTARAHNVAPGLAQDPRTGVETALGRRGNLKSAATQRVQVMLFSVCLKPQQISLLFSAYVDRGFRLLYGYG